MQHEQDELARQVDSLATQLEEAQQATEEAEKAAAEARGRSALLEKSWAAAQEVGVQRGPLARPPAVPLCTYTHTPGASPVPAQLWQG